MKPFKSILPISRWILRITLFAYLVMVHFTLLQTLNFSSLQFYFASVYILFSALLIIGGIFSQGLTVLSSLVIFILALYQLVVSFAGSITSGTVLFLIPISISLFFISSGNKS